MSDQDVFLYFYPIDPPGRLHGFDNKRVKIAIERVKLAVGGAKLLKGLGFDFYRSTARIGRGLRVLEMRHPETRRFHQPS
jgi:hypothetical protein